MALWQYNGVNQLATGGAVIDGSSRGENLASSDGSRAVCRADSERRRPLLVTVLCSSVDDGECRLNGELHKLMSKLVVGCLGIRRVWRLFDADRGR